MSRLAVTALLLALTATLAACITLTPDRYYIVEADVAAELAERPGRVLIDVRPPADYAAEHAAGAISIPLSQLWARMDEIPTRRSTLIIVYDDDAGRAMRAASRLHDEGYDQVYVCRGGLAAWARAGGATAAGEAPPPGFGRGVETW